jgi:hypothetical protein
MLVDSLCQDRLKTADFRHFPAFARLSAALRYSPGTHRDQFRARRGVASLEPSIGPPTTCCGSEMRCAKISLRAARLIPERAAPHRAAAATFCGRPSGGRALPILFHTKKCLTLVQLVPAWARELADGNTSANEVERDLWRYLCEDTINGLLDDAGPLRNGRRRGLAIIGPDDLAQFVEGRLLGRLLAREGKKRSPFFSMPDRILLMKEAVLDFARRHELPPPSWWSDKTTGRKEQTDDAHVAEPAPVSQPSRSPVKSLKQASEAMIIKAIKSAYDAADAAGRKPPNIKELPTAVRPLLEEKGFYASGRYIEELGAAEEFKRRRRPPGKTVSSERPK